jgi:alkylation response protein AidB-like acyl-CoA dehydrogenase
LKLIYPPEAEAFRAEFAAWLDDKLTPDDYADAGQVETPAVTGRLGTRGWAKKLHAAGYGCIAWPQKFGGRDASAAEQMVYAEEMQRVDAPSPPNFTGVTRIGPALMAWGTEEQKRHFLPRILSADDLWCQGFSEPDAGSDLASLRCAAVEDGDAFVVNGHKVWNSGGHQADYCELLVRTDPDASKHHGISCLLVDMRLPGIEVRPIVMLTGESGFNELFFTDVRVPVSALLGPLNQGWAVTRTTLAHERASVADFHPRLRAEIKGLCELSRQIPFESGMVADDPMFRQRLARLYVQGEILKIISDRTKVATLTGQAPGTEGNVSRLVWGPLVQEIAEVRAEFLGPDGVLGPTGRARAGARGNTIAGGTSQIQMTILAERALGLPRSY